MPAEPAVLLIFMKHRAMSIRARPGKRGFLYTARRRSRAGEHRSKTCSAANSPQEDGLFGLTLGPVVARQACSADACLPAKCFVREPYFLCARPA